MAGIKCPRCGLFSPDSAQRCDCGYDFETNTDEKAYFAQELPRQIRGYVVCLIGCQVLLGVVALGAGDPERIVTALVWSAVVWWLYTEMVAKKNWARLWLVVLTFPLGLLLGLSDEVRLYCLQK